MKWNRHGDKGYTSEDGQFWIHRYWYDEGYKTRYRNWWTICVKEPSGDWLVIDDCEGFKGAKEYAERYKEEEA